MSGELYVFTRSIGEAESTKHRREGMAQCQPPEEYRGKKDPRVSEDNKEL
jgi:hypothetical protein